MNSLFSTAATGPWPDPATLRPTDRSPSPSHQVRTRPRWNPEGIVAAVLRAGATLGLLLMAWALVVVLFCLG